MNNLPLLFSSFTTKPKPLKLLDGRLTLYKDPQVTNGNAALSYQLAHGIAPVQVLIK